jgi:hypothetical protein
MTLARVPLFPASGSLAAVAVIAMLLFAVPAQAAKDRVYGKGVDAGSDPSTHAVLWAGNGAHGWVQFTEVDGMKVKGGPDSLALAPGRHDLKLTLHDGSHYADDGREIVLEPGHHYVLRFRHRAAGTRAEISVADLGSRGCRMTLVGSRVFGHDQLVCEGEEPEGTVPPPPPGTPDRKGFH